MKFWTWLKSLFKSTPTYPPAPVIVKPADPVPAPTTKPIADPGIPRWYAIALKEIGVKEVVGKGDNPRVLEYHAATGLHSTDDDVAWCAAFVSWVFVQAKMASKRTAWARDYLLWGVTLKEPRFGCVVVFKRGTGGHVAFYKSGYKTGVIQCLGGNQSNAVNVSGFSEANVLGYRWPTDA